jgi:hypothetical protein
LSSSSAAAGCWSWPPSCSRRNPERTPRPACSWCRKFFRSNPLKF